MFKALFFVFLTFYTSVLSHDFTDCGSTTFTTKSLSISPDPVKAGKDVTITVVGDLTGPYPSTVDISLSYAGMPYTITEKYCELDTSKCTQTQDVTLMASMAVPRFVASGNYNVKAVIYNSDKSIAGCIESTVKVSLQKWQLIEHYINSGNFGWTAGKTKHIGKHIDHLFGTIDHVPHVVTHTAELPVYNMQKSELPTSYDVREMWSDVCMSTLLVGDQSQCGSCWAFASAGAMTDRICIASMGESNPILAPEDLIACCSNCGYGCGGGMPAMAWRYWSLKGLVTGSTKYTDQTGCMPYPISDNKTHPYATPKCEKTCQDNYDTSYRSDKHYGSSHYVVRANMVDDIVTQMKQDLVEYGSLTLAFTVYEDFMTYIGGVYKHVTGDELGGHAVQLVGYVDNGADNRYWVIKNSWNVDWGENGFFRIVMGTNECGIENAYYAGLA